MFPLKDKNSQFQKEKQKEFRFENSLVCKGEEVGRPARTIADNNRHRWVISDVFQNSSDSICAALDDQTDDWDAAVCAFFGRGSWSC
jgi:hypothetical protein